MTGHLRLLLRAGFLATFVAGSVVLAARLTGGPVGDLVRGATSRDLTSAWTVDRLVVDLAAALLLLAAVGLALISGLAMTAALAAERAPGVAKACSRATPRATRRIVTAVLGIGLAAPLAVEGPALAGGLSHVAVCTSRCHHGDGGLNGLRLPDLPTSRPRPAGPADSARQVVVHEGDSLWRIAARRLPAGAAAGDVATLTWRLYALNRSVIGDNPDLIYPGMTLITPKGPS
jgi:nucleoid-associated protein YgaU